ncbi:hypothetical protein DUNSADRAFT_10555 [Dunaliella salina]|uniref:Encoded protein n=1 Tax=Dunaliella salina TaxID=3046 RepID=A0ABQ7GF28_DUNSA|nr:hypothetical protein DUNSADRAFT_10555 [Dunaliella salina]|eukprot:KAF5833205.1 hypothetical protein DUNSADRAFT_10555 [Dunaliella salina]
MSAFPCGNTPPSDLQPSQDACLSKKQQCYAHKKDKSMCTCCISASKSNYTTPSFPEHIKRTNPCVLALDSAGRHSNVTISFPSTKKDKSMCACSGIEQTMGDAWHTEHQAHKCQVRSFLVQSH